MEGMYSDPINRWQGIGPYYAMFPTAFAKRVVTKYTNEGDSILDPFAGRGTSIFAAATNNRSGLGIEINPVGWLYAKAKLSPAPMDDVIERLNFLDQVSHRYVDQIKPLPSFFRHCYNRQVLQFLQAARAHLKWRFSKADATLMSLILVNLHGKYGNALSNQMRQTKSMSPQYAIQWWKENEIRPPKIDPREFFIKKIEWRYKNGLPSVKKSAVYLGDSSAVLSKVREQIKVGEFNRPRLLFTSPPYLGVTNYHYDQWLRLWMLGYPPYPVTLQNRYKRKFEDVKEYSVLLEKVFRKAASIMSRGAVIYVRTDRRKATYQITKMALLKAFPKKKLVEKTRLFHRPTQTQLFKKRSVSNSSSVSGGEIDLIMTPR